MSLVNDMLRDLDQRRKSSDGGGAMVNLMPASDILPEKKNRILILVAVLLIVVAGLLFFFMQNSGDSARQLNITPRVAESATGTTPNTATGAVDRARADDVVEEAVTVASEIPERPDSVATTGQSSQEAVPDPAVTTPGEGGAEPALASAANTNAQAPASTASDVQVEPAQQAPIPAQREAVNVVNQPPAENVKNDAAMSPEARDTLTVQEALRMIANNDTAGAYAHLEKYIIENRYAHQSRETYAKLLMNQGELLAAYNLVESGLALAPNHAGYKKVKARILIADGQIDEAVDLLSSRAPSIEQDIEYHEILATAQLASRDYEGAVISYTSLVQQDQSQGKWWYGFAASQDSLGNRQAAAQAYNRAMQQPNLSPNLRRRSQERLSALSQ